VISLLNALQNKANSELLWFKPNKAQQAFFDLTKDADFLLLAGGNRVGKTLALSIMSYCHLTGIYPSWWAGHRFEYPVNAWIGCTTENSLIDLKDKWFFGEGEVRALFSADKVLHKNSLKHFYKIKHKKGISTVKFKTYKQGRKEWQAKKVDFIGFDEEPPIDVYHEACLRVTKAGTREHGKIAIAATSLYYSEFVNSFFERTRNNEGVKELFTVKPGEIVDKKAYIVSSWDNADHLDEDTKKTQIANMAYHEIEARTQGIPSKGGGKVYPVDEEFIVCNPFEISDDYLIVGGMDFGWTNNTAVILLATHVETRESFLFAEYYANQRTPEEHIAKLIEDPIFSKYITWCPILFDPAGNSKSLLNGKSVASLYSQLNLIPGNNSVSVGIEKVRQAFFNGSLKIFKTCPNVIGELRNYHYIQGTGDPKKSNDHSLDALRYSMLGKDYATSKQTPAAFSFNAKFF